MISCTEFIPAYSELFAWLEKNHGRDEVDRFWMYLFNPEGGSVPLINFVKKEGIRGCYSYWAGTLNEEAADFTMYLNEKAGWFMETMHRCPSKGRLLQLKDEIGLEPYPDYCLHCDSYRHAVEKVGLRYIYNFAGVDKASCSMFIYDPKVFDGRIIMDENTEIMDRRAADNEYFHMDFHSSLNMGLHYVAENYGKDALRDYLRQYTEHVSQKLFAEIEERGLPAIADRIRATYETEKTPDVPEIQCDGNVLDVHIRYCPAVKHLRATGREVSPWYSCSTEMVMEVLAEKAGAEFTMLSYDEETGEARYRFAK